MAFPIESRGAGAIAVRRLAPGGEDLRSRLLEARDRVRRNERGVGREDVGDLLLVLEKGRRVLQNLGDSGLFAAPEPLIGKLRVDRQQGEILERARLVLRRPPEQFGEQLGVVAGRSPGGFIVDEGGLVLVDDAGEGFQEAWVILREGSGRYPCRERR